jgi:hypothetical protein
MINIAWESYPPPWEAAQITLQLSFGHLFHELCPLNGNEAGGLRFGIFSGLAKGKVWSPWLTAKSFELR